MYTYQTAGNGGVILGNLVGALIRALLTEDQLVSWGWRAAFFSGVFIIPVTILVHLCAKEHNPNEGEYDDDGTQAEEGVGNEEEGGGVTAAASSVASSSQRKKNPLKESVKRENWPGLASAMLCAMLYGGGYYVSNLW